MYVINYKVHLGYYIILFISYYCTIKKKKMGICVDNVLNYTYCVNDLLDTNNWLIFLKKNNVPYVH